MGREQWQEQENTNSLELIFIPFPVISVYPWTRLFERLVKLTSGLLTWGQNCVVRRDSRG